MGLGKPDNQQTRMGKVLGIDLGTTNSAMAVWDGREPHLIISDQRASLTPSVVAFGSDGKALVGEIARRQAITNASRTIFSAKRFIGRKFKSVLAEREAAPYQVVAGEKGEALFQIDDNLWSPEQISAHILRQMKATAEAYLEEPVTGAVITVPAHFNNTQRAATKEAGKLAGLEVLRIVNEPTAAALAYGLDKIEDRARVVAVYDFGGGTFDVSILTVGDDIVEVLATHGDTRLGGDDIDIRVATWLVEAFEASSGKEFDGNPEAQQRLLETAKLAKVALSSKEETEINLPFLGTGDNGPVHLQTTLSRAQLESMIGDLVERSLASCTQVLEDAGKSVEEIDDVVLVGGSSRIPLVQRQVEKFFGKEPRSQVNPDEVVALGAAVQAGILSGQLRGLVLVDVTSLSLGIENHEGRAVVVIPRNSTIPVEAMRVFTTSGDNQTSLQFHVVQGESESAEGNDSLNRFTLDGLREAPAGTPQIEVTFSIDINGMVQVHARDRDSGNAQNVTVSVITAMAPEAPKTVTDKESGAEEVSLPSAAQATLGEAEALLQIPGRKLSAVDRGNLTKRSDQLRKLLGDNAGAEDIERARAALEAAIERAKQTKVPRPRSE